MPNEADAKAEAETVEVNAKAETQNNGMNDYRRGHSSAGRAPALHAGGLRFDPAWLHQSQTQTHSNECASVWFFYP